jgi:hypothetical protein
MGRRLVFLAAGLMVAVGAGCFSPPPPPPPPPQICGQSFTTASQYQLSYHNLGHAGLGWITADGFVPVSLPDGSTGWWMSDTMTGTANPDNSVQNPGNVHNSLVQQAASCLSPKFGSPAMINGTGGAWYWPGSSVVQGNTVEVFSYKLVPASGQPGFDWRVVGTTVTRFGLPSLQLLGPPVDLPLNATPQDPYGGDAVPWGIRSFLNPADGKVYLYGTTRRDGPFPFDDAWLARAPFDQPTNLEYFTNPLLPTDPSWSTSFTDAKPMTFTRNLLPDNSPIAQLSVVPYGNRFLASAFEADVFQDQQGRSFVRAWVADTPQGPWQMVVNGTGQPQNVATFQRQTADQIAYDARVAELPGAGWTVVYSVNDPIHQQQNFTLYRGQFAAPTGLPAP